MNIYTLLIIITLLVNASVIIYILSQKRNSGINKSYVYYLINFSFWMLSELILRQNIPAEYITIIFKVTSIFWLSVGIWFLNFSYEFVLEKRSWLFYCLIVLSIVSIVITLTTGLVIPGSEIFNRESNELMGPLFLPVLAIANLVPGLYGLYLIVKKAFNSENILIQRSAKLIFAGAILTISFVFFPNILFPHEFNLRSSLQLAESFSIIQTLFIFIAVFRYKLFGLDIEYLSYNLFSSMKDAVIITDEKLKIIHINNSGLELLGINPHSIKDKLLSETLLDIHTLEEKESEERWIKSGSEQKYILITKNRIIQNREYSSYIFYIKDITLRKVAEQNLIESERNLADLFESSPDGLIVVDKESKMVQVNSEVQNLFGYSKNELLGKEISLLIPHRFRSKHHSKVEGYKNKPRKRRMGDGLDLYGLKKDGSEFSVDIMLSPMTQRDKKMTLCTLRDVSDKKIIEQKLRDNEKNYRNIFQSHPHGIVEINLDGTVTLANKAYAHIYEFEVEEIIGKKVWEINQNKEFIQSIKDFFIALKDSATIPQSLISWRKTKTGKLIEVQTDWDYKKDANNNTIGFIKVVIDVTERKKAEKKLNQQRLMLAQAERLAHLGSWKFNIKTGRLYWSDELIRIYGENKNSFKPTFEEYQKRLHPEDRAEIVKKINIAINTGVSFSHKERIIRPDGETRILSSRGIPQKNELGEVIGLYGSCLDVTEQEKVERALLISQKQLRALSSNLQATREEERTRLAREIHDEFGQILTAVNMDVGLMISELKNNSIINKEIFFSHLESMEELIEKSIKSVQNIATELRLDVLDHLDLISAIEWQLREFEKRYNIETKLEKSLQSLEIDDDKKIALFRIYQEALTNVVRHSKATKVTTVLSRKNDIFEIKVIDNGIGISADKLVSIKSIGLIGIRERILILGGEVFIKTAEKGGTELHFKVPVN